MIVLGENDCSNSNINVSGINIKVTDVVKLLGVNIDSKLNFKKHIEKMCKTATQKSKALFRVRDFLSFWTSQNIRHFLYYVKLLLLPVNIDVLRSKQQYPLLTKPTSEL